MMKVGVFSAAAFAAAATLGLVIPAHALPVDLLSGNNQLGIYTGSSSSNSPDYPNTTELTIFLKTLSGSSSGSGNVGTNNTGQPIVDFATNPGTTVDFSNGNANIKNPSTLWTSLTVNVPATPSFTGAFGDLFFDVQLQDPGKTRGVQNPFDVTIEAFNGASSLGSLTLNNTTDADLKTNAAMGFLVIGENNNLITSIVISSTSGFSELKNFSISDLQVVEGCTENCNPGGGGLATPLPGAIWLFGTALAGGAGIGRWRKKRKASRTIAA